MPRISEFNGIIVAMYFNDHSPPHFHVAYGGDEASLHVETLEVLEGIIETRILRLVRQWAALHHAELTANWERARQGLTLDKIEPLE